MKVPDKFPPGCVFGMDLDDDDGVELSFVKFPDGRVFFINERESWKGLQPSPGNLWPSRWRRLSEEKFLELAKDSA